MNKDNPSFPYNWLKPGEYRCEPDGSWDPTMWEEMVRVAGERRVKGLPPLYWMK